MFSEEHKDMDVSNTLIFLGIPGCIELINIVLPCYTYSIWHPHCLIRNGLFTLNGGQNFAMTSSFPGGCAKCKNNHSHL